MKKKEVFDSILAPTIREHILHVANTSSKEEILEILESLSSQMATLEYLIFALKKKAKERGIEIIDLCEPVCR